MGGLIILSLNTNGEVRSLTFLFKLLLQVVLVCILLVALRPTVLCLISMSIRARKIRHGVRHRRSLGILLRHLAPSIRGIRRLTHGRDFCRFCAVLGRRHNRRLRNAQHWRHCHLCRRRLYVVTAVTCDGPALFPRVIARDRGNV
ncbi:hypothetical protein EDD21DRAFT_35897, partial [Dissophora ornata]